MISVITMQNRSTLDIDAVRTFILIADFKSFTRAAQAVGMTQSAISLQLKRLEARLASRLIERTPRSVELTTEGTVFLDRARDLVAAHDRADRATLADPRHQRPCRGPGATDSAGTRERIRSRSQSRCPDRPLE